MSIVIEGVYKASGQPDVLVPVKVDATGRLETTATATVSSEVEIKNDTGNAIPTEPLGLPTQAWQLAVTATAASQVLTSGVKRISIKARGCDIRYSISGAASATTSHFIEAGERLDIRVNAGTTISAIRDSAATVNGSLAITELA